MVKILISSIFIIISKYFCYPKNSLEKQWKMNKRFVVKDAFFEQSIDSGIRNNCSLDLILDELACFRVENVFTNDGAFIEDFLFLAKLKRTTIKIIQSTTTSMELQTTTTTINQIQCLDPKWALVKPAVIYMMNQQLGKVPEDYALRAGFMDYRKNEFEEKHINDTIAELLKNSKMRNDISDKIRNELANWVGKNGEWVQNIEHGKFQYFPIENSFAQTIEIVMLLYECSFGKFIFGPVERDESIQITETFNWKNDFDHLDQCIEKQDDISKDQLSVPESTYLMLFTDFEKKELNLRISIGITMTTDKNVTFDDAEFETFKYKYGYTNPIRGPNLYESANDWERVKRMGRIILPIESVSRNLNDYGLEADFRIISRTLLTYLDLAKFDCDEAEEYGANDCVVCLIEGEDCAPDVKCHIMQTIYECEKYTLRLPRIDGRANFMVNKTNYQYNNQVNWYLLKNDTYYRKMNAMIGISDYILYDEDSLYKD